MKASIENHLQLRIYMRLHRTLKQIIQLGTFALREAMPQGLKFSPVFVADMGLTSNQGGNHCGKYWTGLPALMRKVRFNQSPQTSDHHFVANT